MGFIKNGKGKREGEVTVGENGIGFVFFFLAGGR